MATKHDREEKIFPDADETIHQDVLGALTIDGAPNIQTQARVKFHEQLTTLGMVELLQVMSTPVDYRSRRRRTW